MLSTYIYLSKCPLCASILKLWLQLYHLKGDLQASLRPNGGLDLGIFKKCALNSKQEPQVLVKLKTGSFSSWWLKRKPNRCHGLSYGFLSFSFQCKRHTNTLQGTVKWSEGNDLKIKTPFSQHLFCSRNIPELVLGIEDTGMKSPSAYPQGV